MCDLNMMKIYFLSEKKNITALSAGPQENPDDCGTPILCMFYGLLLGILALTIYTTIKVIQLENTQGHEY